MKNLAIFLIFFAFIACSSSKEKDPVVITSIKINAIDKELKVGDEYQMTVTTEPNAKVNPVWSSSNPDVATISNKGKLKVIADGSTTITAKIGSLSNNILISVFEVRDFTSFVLRQDKMRLMKNCIISYKTDNGEYKKIITLGDLTIMQPTEEMRLNFNNVPNIYVFSDDLEWKVQHDTVYTLKTNRKNILILSHMTYHHVVDPTNPMEYPN